MSGLNEVKKVKVKNGTSTKDGKKSRSKSKEKKKDKENGTAERKSAVKDVKKEKSKKDKKSNHISVPDVPIQEEYKYEDDFEDYEDDFEPDSEPEVATQAVSKTETVVNVEPPSPTVPAPAVVDSMLLRRMENRRAAGGGGNQKVEEIKNKEMSPRISSATRKIDFTNARERDYGNQPTWLSNFHSIVKFELVTQQLNEITPLTSYDYYIQLFGKGNQNQSSTQTNDDSCSAEVQTETRESDSIWTQFPPNDNLGIGWGRSFNDSLEESSEVDLLNDTQLERFRDQRYVQFVDIAGKLITDLMNTKLNFDSNVYFSNKSKFAFSAGFESFSLKYAKIDARVSAVTVRNSQGYDAVLTAFYVKQSSIPELSNRSVIVEFRLEQDHVPSTGLIADNEVTAISYGPEDSPIICAGLIDGSCVAYDTNESSRFHRKYKLPWPGVKDGIPLRVPSYDTSFQACVDHKQNKGSPVIWIVAVGKVASFSFQLVTINQLGVITLFTLTESSVVLSDKIIDADFGVRPTSRIKLIKTSVIPNIISPTKNLVANCMVINPSNVYQVLIATNDGSIINYTRVKQGFTGPKVFKDQSCPISEVFSLRFSHFNSKIFAAGLSCGSISIYRSNQQNPIFTLFPPNSSRLSVTNVEWSPTTSHILYSIHGGERILIWDLATGKSPLHVCDIQAEFGAKIISIIVWRNENNIGLMGFGLTNGTLAVHALERLVTPKDEDLLEIAEKFQKMI
uniref:WD repeat-containing protein 60 n=1 Tax=Panagrolaimus sp. JU765 TaxID=591449 RepID=A0AC34QBE2_9BILA